MIPMSSRLNPILQYADSYIIADHRSEIEVAEHISISSSIYTDGQYKYHIDSATGYIHITELKFASYLAYIDIHNKVYIHIYREVHEEFFKIITDSLISLHEQINQDVQLIEKNAEKEHVNINPDDISNIDKATLQLLLHANGLMDLNNLHCDECGSTIFKEPVMCDDNRTIECQCSKCYTIYRLIPSRYYTIHSKTIFPDISHIDITNKIRTSKFKNIKLKGDNNACNNTTENSS